MSELESLARQIIETHRVELGQWEHVRAFVYSCLNDETIEIALPGMEKGTAQEKADDYKTKADKEDLAMLEALRLSLESLPMSWAMELLATFNEAIGSDRARLREHGIDLTAGKPKSV
jgi:hypothetical protein